MLERCSAAAAEPCLRRERQHRGGVGVGIDLATGRTLVGIQNNRYIEKHPETGHSLRDRQIPNWQTILEMAAKLGEKTEFGYLGVDIVLDREKGPLLLEINARPGLSIQIANREGLIPRLEAIDRVLPKLSGVQEKIAFAQEAFAVGTSLRSQVTISSVKGESLTR